MTEQRDPFLQDLFLRADEDLEGEAITTWVMARTHRFRLLLAGGAASAALVLLAGAWMMFAMPLLEFAVLIANALGTALFDLGEGWLALVFMPVNNIASVLVIGLRAMHLAWKKLISASFGS